MFAGAYTFPSPFCSQGYNRPSCESLEAELGFFSCAEHFPTFGYTLTTHMYGMQALPG